MWRPKIGGERPTEREPALDVRPWHIAEDALLPAHRALHPHFTRAYSWAPGASAELASVMLMGAEQIA